MAQILNMLPYALDHINHYTQYLPGKSEVYDSIFQYNLYPKNYHYQRTRKKHHALKIIPYFLS